MLKIQTYDDELQGFCTLWDQIPSDDNIFEKFTLNDGSALIQLNIHLHKPILDVENYSINPTIHQADHKSKMTIHFFLPCNLDDSYDTLNILSVMTSLVTDTLSIYCSLDADTRFRAEQIIHDKNNRFIKQIGDLPLSQIIEKLNDVEKLTLHIMEVGLGGTDSTSLIDSADKDLSMDEEKSHISHKLRMTNYKFIVSPSDIVAFHSPFFHPETRRESIKYIHHTALLWPDVSPYDSFFSFLKHVSASYRELEFFPKNSLTLNQDQLKPIKTNFNRTFDKNKSIQTSFIQMMLLQFYILMKEELTKDEFTKLLRETSLPVEAHQKIYSLTYNKLPEAIIFNLEKTLNPTIKIDDEFININFPFQTLMINPDTLNEDIINANDDKKELIKQFEKLSRKYHTKKTQEPFDKLVQEAKTIMNLLQQKKLLNTIISLYAHKHFLNTVKDVDKLKGRISGIQDNKENIEEALELLLMNLSLSKIDGSPCLEDNTNYTDTELTIKNEEKLDRISGNIDDFLHYISNQMSQIWSDYEYEDVLSGLYSEDHYIEKLSEDNQAFKKFEKTIPKLIYTIIGYYFNFHSTQEIIHTLKNSNVPTIGEIYSPLVERMPLKFDHVYNSFTPTRSEFNEEEYKNFKNKIHLLCEKIT